MAPHLSIYNPAELGTPLGPYSQVAPVKANEPLFIAAMVAVDPKGQLAGDGDFEAQAGQASGNIHTALRSAGADWANVVQFTTPLVHSQDVRRFINFRLREFPKMLVNASYPPNTLLIVDRLVREALLIEVQTVATL